ncbi:MAG: DUF4058 domain-containing protein [Gemmataceae bacterium]|nr:DUF4058 domain-containing protein [Gemmataceae bacterium]
MPIHDWTRVDAGTYHDFHQVWTIAIRNALNRGILPPGYMALADLKVGGVEPDVAALKLRRPPEGAGLAVSEAPPRTRQVQRAETGPEFYARKANRIVVKHRRGELVAAMEVVSPGNKASNHELGAFVRKAAGYLRNEINVVVIDPFPPGPRDPDGLHALIWDEFTSSPADPRPADKPLTVVSYDAGERTAYIDPVAVGDPWPDAALFLAPGWYVNVPLERTYLAAWGEMPQVIRAEVAPPG